MRKFGAYPIKVNYNLHTRLRYQHNEDEFHRAGRYEEERQLDIKVNTSSDLTITNYLYKQELEAYEQTVCNCLRKIEGNPVGRMVLGLINKNTTVWIVPKSDKELKQCTCALTGPLNYDIQKDGSVARGVGSGDTVILFHPDLGDDTLLHELVHAYRYSYNKFYPMNVDYRTDVASFTITSEEVLAHQIEDIYMSQAKRPLTLDYKTQAPAEKKEIYDFLTDNYFLLQALKYFLRHEYLAMLAAHTFTNTEYNPFRDYAALEAEYLKGSVSPNLPELGTPLGR
ncbi:MAG: hypothetical protein WAN60_03830 [Candidatus Sulfotelmatobacter sp.]